LDKIKLLYKEESYRIIGACIEVHKELGCGLLEAVYQEALAKEFILQEIPFQREVDLPIYYKEDILDKKYLADFLCYNSIVIELKAIDSLRPEHKAQVINYLKPSHLELGLLINFGSLSLTYERLVRLKNR
jgi:GxxExxY protein